MCNGTYDNFEANGQEKIGPSNHYSRRGFMEIGYTFAMDVLKNSWTPFY